MKFPTELFKRVFGGPEVEPITKDEAVGQINARLAVAEKTRLAALETSKRGLRGKAAEPTIQASTPEPTTPQDDEVTRLEAEQRVTGALIHDPDLAARRDAGDRLRGIRNSLAELRSNAKPKPSEAIPVSTASAGTASLEITQTSPGSTVAEIPKVTVGTGSKG